MGGRRTRLLGVSEATVSRPAQIPAPEPGLTAETIISRARALIPEIRAQADEAEKAGRHTAELDRKFVEAGFYRCCSPGGSAGTRSGWTPTGR